MLFSHLNSNILASCNIYQRGVWTESKSTGPYFSTLFFFFFLTERAFNFPKPCNFSLNTLIWLTTKLNSPIMSVFEFHNYLQEQRVRFSILLHTALSLFPRGQWQILLASDKKIGQEWMGFTSHTKFSVTACQEALPSSTFLEDVSRRAIFGNWHNLRPPNKCVYIYLLNLTL